MIRRCFRKSKVQSKSWVQCRRHKRFQQPVQRCAETIWRCGLLVCSRELRMMFRTIDGRRYLDNSRPRTLVLVMVWSRSLYLPQSRSGVHPKYHMPLPRLLTSEAASPHFS